MRGWEEGERGREEEHVDVRRVPVWKCYSKHHYLLLLLVRISSYGCSDSVLGSGRMPERPEGGGHTDCAALPPGTEMWTRGLQLVELESQLRSFQSCCPETDVGG